MSSSASVRTGAVCPSCPKPATAAPRRSRRLRGFERVTLAPRQSETVTFRMTPADVGYYDNEAQFVVEQGTVEVLVGTSSDDDRLRTEIMVS
jgi:beta-glucosidase